MTRTRRSLDAPNPPACSACSPRSCAKLVALQIRMRCSARSGAVGLAGRRPLSRITSISQMRSMALLSRATFSESSSSTASSTWPDRGREDQERVRTASRPRWRIVSQEPISPRGSTAASCTRKRPCGRNCCERQVLRAASSETAPWRPQWTRTQGSPGAVPAPPVAYPKIFSPRGSGASMPILEAQCVASCRRCCGLRADDDELGRPWSSSAVGTRSARSARATPSWCGSTPLAGLRRRVRRSARAARRASSLVVRRLPDRPAGEDQVRMRVGEPGSTVHGGSSITLVPGPISASRPSGASATATILSSRIVSAR